MARLTGKAGAASLAGGTVAVVNAWEYEESSNNIETPAMGDTYTDRTHLRKDWRASITALIGTTPPYDIHTDLVGTEVAIALKILAADTNPIITDTGLVNSVRLGHTVNDATQVEIEVVSSDGSAGPTYDESPAS